MTSSNENRAAIVGIPGASSSSHTYRHTGTDKDDSDEVHKLLRPVMRTKRCGFILLTIALIASCMAFALSLATLQQPWITASFTSFTLHTNPMTNATLEEPMTIALNPPGEMKGFLSHSCIMPTNIDSNRSISGNASKGQGRLSARLRLLSLGSLRTGATKSKTPLLNKVLSQSDTNKTKETNKSGMKSISNSSAAKSTSGILSDRNQLSRHDETGDNTGSLLPSILKQLTQSKTSSSDTDDDNSSSSDNDTENNNNKDGKATGILGSALTSRISTPSSSSSSVSNPLKGNVKGALGSIANASGVGTRMVNAISGCTSWTKFNDVLKDAAIPTTGLQIAQIAVVASLTLSLLAAFLLTLCIVCDCCKSRCCCTERWAAFTAALFSFAAIFFTLIAIVGLLSSRNVHSIAQIKMGPGVMLSFLAIAANVASCTLGFYAHQSGQSARMSARALAEALDIVDFVPKRAPPLLRRPRRNSRNVNAFELSF